MTFEEWWRTKDYPTYFGLKPCCDCGRTGHYTVNKNGYQFTVCADCVQNYTDVEEEENND